MESLRLVVEVLKLLPEEASNVVKEEGALRASIRRSLDLLVL